MVEPLEVRNGVGERAGAGDVLVQPIQTTGQQNERLSVADRIKADAMASAEPDQLGRGAIGIAQDGLRIGERLLQREQHVHDALGQQRRGLQLVEQRGWTAAGQHGLRGLGDPPQQVTGEDGPGDQGVDAGTGGQQGQIQQ